MFLVIMSLHARISNIHEVFTTILKAHYLFNVLMSTFKMYKTFLLHRKMISCISMRLINFSIFPFRFYGIGTRNRMIDYWFQFSGSFCRYYINVTQKSVEGVVKSKKIYNCPEYKFDASMLLIDAFHLDYNW